MMDDWVVEAVAMENYNMMQILSQLQDFIKSSKMLMNDYEFQIQQTQLFTSIGTKVFYSNATPLYLANVWIPNEEIEGSRF